MPRRYRIYLLSAQSILSYAKEVGGTVTITLNRDAARRCQLPGRQEQEENALFFQIQCALHGNGFTPTEEPGVVEDLSAVLCYVDFSGIFDRSPALPRVAAQPWRRSCSGRRASPWTWGTGPGSTLLSSVPTP
ncbi:MAG: hypothetical protein ACLULM_06520 [Acutalibacter sp.]